MDEIAVLAAELTGLIDRLRDLLPEPVVDPTQGSAQHHKISGSPAPWHAEAGPVYMTIHAGVRDLEQDLRYRITGRLGERGGSDVNTVRALRAIVRLAHGVPEDVAQEAAARLDGWIREAKSIRDIAEHEKYVPLHVPRGQLPPACPYCKTYSIRIAKQSGRVVCANARCEDSNGDRPHGTIDRNAITGDGVIAWADGRTVYYTAAA